MVYNEIVATAGYEMEFAAGTTYSLDAESFLALSLSMGRLGEASEGDFENPYRLLEGLRNAMKRVAIFCNRGGLQPPRRKNALFAMLDKCVFEVGSDKEPLANFHPKLWIIKERSLENRSKRQIKLVVLSRNLTKDTSLDIAASMTAPLGVRPDEETRRKHEPLKKMLTELAPYANTEKRKDINRLVKEMDTMGRFELDKEYIDYDFVPIHFGRYLNEDIDVEEEMPGRRMIIVSPFIDRGATITVKGATKETPISSFNKFAKGEEKVLITRLESLTPEVMKLYEGENREVWVMSPAAEQNDIQPMNLHAKMYYTWGPRQGGIYLWMGSANATYSGFHRNSEFLLRLKERRGKHQFESFKKEWCDEDKQLCQRVTSLPAEEGAEREDHTLEIKVKQNLINRNNLRAEIEKEGDLYIINIYARKMKDIPGTVKIAPIQEPDNFAELSPETKKCVITTRNVANLSEFYIISVTPSEGSKAAPVVMTKKISTSGIPDDRDDRIYQSLINTREKFLNYIEMMITDRPLELAELMTALAGKGNGGTSVGEERKPALYESLLRIAATNPEKFDDIQELTRRLDSDVMPSNFNNMIKAFKDSGLKFKV